jgi:hypothetical protein
LAVWGPVYVNVGRKSETSREIKKYKTKQFMIHNCLKNAGMPQQAAGCSSSLGFLAKVIYF